MGNAERFCASGGGDTKGTRRRIRPWLEMPSRLGSLLLVVCCGSCDGPSSPIVLTSITRIDADTTRVFSDAEAAFARAGHQLVVGRMRSGEPGSSARVEYEGPGAGLAERALGDGRTEPLGIHGSVVLAGGTVLELDLRPIDGARSELSLRLVLSSETAFSKEALAAAQREIAPAVAVVDEVRRRYTAKED
jgi:hypothetical protein